MRDVPYLGCKEGQDAGAAANIQDDLVLEEELVLHDGCLVAARPYSVFEHLLMNTCKAAGADSQASPWMEDRPSATGSTLPQARTPLHLAQETERPPATLS